MMKGGKPIVKMEESGKSPVAPKPGDPGYDERDFRATDKYKRALKKRSKKYRKSATAKTAIGKKFKSAASRHAHRRALDFKGKKYEYKPRKYKPKSDTTFEKGGKFPDLTGDGKVTQADVLKGRGVFKKGGKTKKGGMSGLDAAEKQVYKRGLAAYMSSGNRPKVSQHAWAMARVKSAFGKREAAKIRAGKGGKKKK